MLSSSKVTVFSVPFSKIFNLFSIIRHLYHRIGGADVGVVGGDARLFKLTVKHRKGHGHKHSNNSHHNEELSQGKGFFCLFSWSSPSGKMLRSRGERSAHRPLSSASAEGAFASQPNRSAQERGTNVNQFLLCKFWFRLGSSCRSGHIFATDFLSTGYSYNMSCRIHSCRKIYPIIINGRRCTTACSNAKLTIIKIIYSSFRKCGTAVCCKNAFFSLIKLCVEHWNCDCYQNCDDCDNNQEFCQGEGFFVFEFFHHRYLFVSLLRCALRLGCGA